MIRQFYARMRQAEKLSRNAYEDVELIAGMEEFELQPPEQTLIRLLQPDLPRMRMLDIGIGRGRTTAHFCHLVEQYVGVDISHALVASCEDRFRDQANTSFYQVDARALTQFDDRSFDLVLFSFNGLDLLSPAGRHQALQEIVRVCKVGGLFIYSAHNIRYRYSFLPESRGGKTWRTSQLVRSIWPRLTDRCTSGYYRLEWIYGQHPIKIRCSRPETQLKQIARAGFETLEVIRLSGERASIADVQQYRDRWLYYLCRKLETVPDGQ